MKLDRATLKGISTDVVKPNYLDSGLSSGIVHIGLGNFHKGHQAWYTNRLLNDEPGNWLISAANLHSDANKSAMVQQDNLFTVVSSDGAHTRTEINGAITQVFGGRDRAGLLAQLQSAATQIVTLTVTEKGYCLDASGNLDINDRAIRADFTALVPSTMPGIIVRALQERRKQGLAPFTVVSCDNLANNGAALNRCLSHYAQASGTSLAAFIESDVSCPATMVDRIVPATTTADRDQIASLLGCDDHCGIATEAFSQWVLEDAFPLGRPAWERVGAIFSHDVARFEVMKLRLLNGAHSALAYLGVLGDIETIADCVKDKVLQRWLRDFMQQEIVPFVDGPEQFDLHDYCDNLMQRFANATLRHRCQQIAMDGSQKLPQRWLPVMDARLARGLASPHYELALAAWIRHLKGQTLKGTRYAIDDPLQEQLTTIAKNAPDTNALVAQLFERTPIFPGTFADSSFRQRVSENIARLDAKGLRACLSQTSGTRQ